MVLMSRSIATGLFWLLCDHNGLEVSAWTPAPHRQDNACPVRSSSPLFMRSYTPFSPYRHEQEYYTGRQPYFEGGPSFDPRRHVGNYDVKDRRYENYNDYHRYDPLEGIKYREVRAPPPLHTVYYGPAPRHEHDEFNNHYNARAPGVQMDYAHQSRQPYRAETNSFRESRNDQGRETHFNYARQQDNYPNGRMDTMSDVLEEAESTLDRFGRVSHWSGDSHGRSRRNNGSSLQRQSLLDDPLSLAIMSELELISKSQEDATVQHLLKEVERHLNADVACQTALGSPIRIGRVISSSIESDGQQQQGIQVSVLVRGSDNVGRVKLQATPQGGIDQLVLQIADQSEVEINVKVSTTSDGASNPEENDENEKSDVIDAEILETQPERATAYVV